MVIFWILGAIQEPLRFAALCSVVVFMGGLAMGRILSLLVDGIPVAPLVIYLVLEVGFALLGYKLAKSLPAS